MNPPQPVPRIKQLEAEINGEHAKWAEKGMKPTPEFVLNCRLRAFVKALEKLGITEEDLNLMLNEIVLAEMQQVREEVERNQAAEQVKLLVPSKKLVDQNGNPLG
jgi:hypothetical protein